MYWLFANLTVGLLMMGKDESEVATKKAPDDPPHITQKLTTTSFAPTTLARLPRRKLSILSHGLLLAPISELTTQFSRTNKELRDQYGIKLTPIFTLQYFPNIKSINFYTSVGGNCVPGLNTTDDFQIYFTPTLMNRPYETFTQRDGQARILNLKLGALTEQEHNYIIANILLRSIPDGVSIKSMPGIFSAPTPIPRIGDREKNLSTNFDILFIKGETTLSSVLKEISEKQLNYDDIDITACRASPYVLERRRSETYMSTGNFYDYILTLDKHITEAENRILVADKSTPRPISPQAAKDLADMDTEKKILVDKIQGACRRLEREEKNKNPPADFIPVPAKDKLDRIKEICAWHK